MDDLRDDLAPDSSGSRSLPAASRPAAPRAAALSPLADAPLSMRESRKQALADHRRALVLNAARAAFAELGLEGASLREIAKRAGYTPGAIYSYFRSKEEVYGALLAESLDRLDEAILGACATAGSGSASDPASEAPRARQARIEATTRAAARALFAFYQVNPRDLDLGFYLFQGLRPRGLTQALNEELNARLLAALDPIESGLIALGLDAVTARAELTALFAHSVGLLLLSHTGRIRMFRQDSTLLIERYLDQLLERATRSGSSEIGSAGTT